MSYFVIFPAVCIFLFDFFPLFFFPNVLFLKVLCNLFILFLIFISWGSPLMTGLCLFKWLPPENTVSCFFGLPCCFHTGRLIGCNDYVKNYIN